MTLQAAQLAWPGIDKERALAAARSLESAARGLTSGVSLFLLKEDVRIARGLLGAIGFEQHGRL